MVGSPDSIIDLVRKYMEDMPGELSYRPAKSDKTLWVFWSLTADSSHKIRSALQHLELYDDGFPVLIQFWAPITIDGRRFLKTSEQPFALTRIDEGLCLYRKRSLDYKFAVDGEIEEELGFPARVFCQKSSESTPNVRYYSSKEHPWCDRAVDCNDLGLLALPVFERSSQSCVGVLELVTTELSIATFSKAVCTALEAVDLKCLGECNNFDEKIRNEGLQQAVDDIFDVLQMVCDTHKLPLAQTWVPCRHCGREVMSTILDAYYGEYPGLEAFRDASSVLHLQKGQGVAGNAYLSHNSYFCKDITQLSLTDYPLVHYARYFDLVGCLAVCLQSNYTREDNYILEFFLQTNVHPQTLLDSILATVKHHFPNFKVASSEELVVELPVEAIIRKPDSFQICQTARSPPRPLALQNGAEIVQVDTLDQQLRVEDDATSKGMKILGAEKRDTSVTCFGKKGAVKRSERELGSTCEVPEQHFGRKPEDGAESLGTGRSSLKRNCRQHNISRWPSQTRKRNKVYGHPSKGGPPCSDLPPGQALATVAHTTPHVTTVQDARNVTIKAAYGDDTIIKFQLSFMSGMADLEEEIMKRLKLKVGSFEIKYKDKDDSWVSITSDADLRHCLNTLTPLGTTAIRMLIQLNQNVTVVQDVRTVTIKAAYGDDTIIKFQLSFMSGMVDLEEEIVKRLKLKVGSFEIKYKDKDDSWVSITSDADLQHCMNTLTPLGTTTIRMLIQPNQNVTAVQDARTVTIKATYGDDTIIKFQLSFMSGMVDLEKEIVKRLKLKVGSFEIKYQDKDDGWVSINSDADLQHCMNTLTPLGATAIRMLIQSITN